MSTTAEALRVIAGALAGVDHDARRTLSCTERLALIEDARDALRRLEGLMGALVAEADHANASMLARGTPLTSWLALEGRLSSGEASGVVFAARDAASHPDLQQACVEGRVTSRQARSIAKVMGELPGTLTSGQKDAAARMLVERAASTPAGRLASMGAQVLAEVAPRAAASGDDVAARLEAQRTRAVSRRSLTWASDQEGSVLFQLSLPTLEAASLTALVDAYVESERRQGRDRSPDRADPKVGLRSLAQRRADGFIRLVADHQVVRRAPKVAGDRPRIVVIMQEADLRQRAEQAGLLASGEAISPGDLRRLCCDADLAPVVLGTRSEILDVGRAHRLVPAPIRRALNLRDGRCQFPRCDVTAHQCDTHHTRPFRWSRVTNLDDSILLCPHHHALCEPPRFDDVPTDDRWEIRRIGPGRLAFLPPATLDPHRTPLPGNGPPAPLLSGNAPAAPLLPPADPPDAGLCPAVVPADQTDAALRPAHLNPAHVNPPGLDPALLSPAGLSLAGLNRPAGRPPALLQPSADPPDAALSPAPARASLGALASEMAPRHDLGARRASADGAARAPTARPSGRVTRHARLGSMT